MEDSSTADAANIIAKLLVTSDEELEAFRSEHFAGGEVTLGRLKASRDLMAMVASWLGLAERATELAPVEASMEAAHALLEQIEKPDTVRPVAPKVGALPTVEIPPGAELPFSGHASADPVAPRVVDEEAGASVGTVEVAVDDDQA